LILNLFTINAKKFGLGKRKFIEALLGDWSGNKSNLPNSACHEMEVKETEEKFQAGSIEVLDWQQAKKELRSQFEKIKINPL
jgi:hypothetical protein